MEDFAKFSNANPDCADPPAWLIGYDNKSRVYGWWYRLNKLVDIKTGKDKEKLSPYTGKPMKYLGRATIEELIGLSCGNVVGVDFHKGRPVERLLSPDELEWLRNLEWRPPPHQDYGLEEEIYLTNPPVVQKVPDNEALE